MLLNERQDATPGKPFTNSEETALASLYGLGYAMPRHGAETMVSTQKDWSPGTYLKFEAERTRPPRDLLAQVPLDAPRRVVDVGCGPGNSTELLVRRFPDAEVIGLDSSPAMIEAASKRLPGQSFILADATTWVPEPGTDLVFANASYQWVPHHDAAFVRVLDALDEGGALAVQMPDTLGEPSHNAMARVARAKGHTVDESAREKIGSPRDYFAALRPHARHVDVWMTYYHHLLDGPAAIAEWFKSTGLRPFLDPLDEAERQAFVEAYVAEIAQHYPQFEDGKVLLRFPRIFILAVK